VFGISVEFGEGLVEKINAKKIMKIKLDVEVPKTVN